MEHAGRTGGLPFVGTGWYRLRFDVPEYTDGKKCTLVFDGAMSHARVYINGKEAGYWPNGYNAFSVNASPFLKQGESNTDVYKRQMYPWGATRYFDEKSGDWISIQPEPGTQEFADFWRPFLLDFREHLKENGWFEKTAIAMDEKLEPIMTGVISFIKETTPDFKIALAGGYIPSLQEDIYDLSIFVGHPTTSENMPVS